MGTLPFVGVVYAKKLEKLNIRSVKDLFYHIPRKYLDFSKSSKIAALQIDELATIKGEVTSSVNQYTKSAKKIQIAQIADSTGKIKCIWFNQPYVVRIFHPGAQVSVAGKIGWFGREKAFISPEYEVLTSGKKALHTQGIIPVYPETSGLSSKWLRRRLSDTLKKYTKLLKDPLPPEILKKNNLMSLSQALKCIHSPTSAKNAKDARRRLAFDELLALQIASLKRKREWQKKNISSKIKINQKAIGKFVNSLPYKLTNSQNSAIGEILGDLQKNVPMNRMLEGDVGSGKTVVAAAAAFCSFENGCQTIVMAPTQILANQHFETLENLLSPFKARVSLITSAVKKTNLGRSDVIVGTHSLIHNKVNFDKVALVVIDEQHKFGVEQRTHLVRLTATAPHVLTMTATPIPRTVALTLYGDLDLSVLTEMPKGRKKITTWLVPIEKRQNAYKWVGEQISQKKIQAFVVCPLIDVSDKESMENVKAVKKEFEAIKKSLPNFTVGLLHSKLKNKQRESVIAKFKKGAVDILVSTPVIEVGIDIPNATIMVIEDADRFGLAQLHQLRGREGRGKQKSYCLLFTENSSQKVEKRLSALRTSLSGFELAEMDLNLRGPGEVFGTRQHGFPELKIASWQDIDLIKKTKELAQEMLEI